MDELINKLDNEKLGYISVDCKSMDVHLSIKKRLLDKYIDEVKFLPEDGGYVKTDFGFGILFFSNSQRFL